jgi:hypothetical protein
LVENLQRCFGSRLTRNLALTLHYASLDQLDRLLKLQHGG